MQYVNAIELTKRVAFPGFVYFLCTSCCFIHSAWNSSLLWRHYCSIYASGVVNSVQLQKRRCMDRHRRHLERELICKLCVQLLLENFQACGTTSFSFTSVSLSYLSFLVVIWGNIFSILQCLFCLKALELVLMETTEAG